MCAFHLHSHRATDLHILTEVTKTLITPLELGDLLDAVMETIAAVFETAEFGVVWLWDETTGYFRPQAICGPDFPRLQQLRQLALCQDESIVGKVYREGEAAVFATPADVANAMSDLRPANLAIWQQGLSAKRLPVSIIAVPLWASGEKYGVLMLGTLHSNSYFDDEDVPFIQILADLIALAIERARLEREARAMREAQEAERLRAEALALLSHELRTSLGAIKGYCTALLIEETIWPRAKQTEFLRRIDAECQSLETMIGELLDSALIDAGQLTVEYQPVRLERLTQEVIEEMQAMTNIHEFTLAFPDHFPLADADPRRIKQVLRNLVNNAIKYAPEGGMVTIRGERRTEELVLSVTDQGLGIAEKDMHSLFEKYFRVSGATAQQIPGTGLGLPVARSIVEAHDGRIWAESSVGQGTTFYFSLPYQALHSESEAQDE